MFEYDEKYLDDLKIKTKPTALIYQENRGPLFYGRNVKDFQKMEN